MPDSPLAMPGAALATIPAGSFAMGTDRGQEDEQPPRRVVLDSFELAVYPVRMHAVVEARLENGLERRFVTPMGRFYDDTRDSHLRNARADHEAQCIRLSVAVLVARRRGAAPDRHARAHPEPLRPADQDPTVDVIRFAGSISRGALFERQIERDLTFRLEPDSEGWRIVIVLNRGPQDEYRQLCDRCMAGVIAISRGSTSCLIRPLGIT
jgi:hypothetical protein